MGFSRQEYWNGLPFPPPEDPPDPGIKLESSGAPALAGRFFTVWATRLTLISFSQFEYSVFSNRPLCLSASLTSGHLCWLPLYLECPPYLSFSGKFSHFWTSQKPLPMVSGRYGLSHLWTTERFVSLLRNLLHLFPVQLWGGLVAHLVFSIRIWVLQGWWLAQCPAHILCLIYSC